MTALCQATQDKGSQLMVYEAGAIGYQLFRFDEQLMQRTVHWFKVKLNQGNDAQLDGKENER